MASALSHMNSDDYTKSYFFNPFRAQWLVHVPAILTFKNHTFRPQHVPFPKFTSTALTGCLL